MAFWTAIAALAAIVAAVGAVGVLLATTLQLRDGRIARDDDYFRKLTPFLSFDVPTRVDLDVTSPVEVDIYSDGGGYAFNVIAKVVQTNSPTQQNAWLTGQTALRYMRDGQVKRMGFGSPLGDTFVGELDVEFKDMFGLGHSARQPVKIVGGQLATTDAIEWTCCAGCRVHLMNLHPPAGRLTRIAQSLQLY